MTPSHDLADHERIVEVVVVFEARLDADAAASRHVHLDGRVAQQAWMLDDERENERRA